MRLTGATTILRPPLEVYAMFSEFEQLPTFMAHLDEVRPLSGTTSRWTATAPFGRTVSWEAETVAADPGRRLAWRSLDGADVANRGEVTFTEAPGDRGTEVRVRIDYDIPAGPLGAAVARFFGEEPHQQVDDDLRRLKQVLETGEVLHSDGAPGGNRAMRSFPQHPAQPQAPAEGTPSGTMRALCYAGRNKVEVRDVPRPTLLGRRDAIVRVTSTAICGSDLHLVDGYVPTMQDGDVLGHEFMGEVVEVGPGVDGDRLTVGDRVVVPFLIACGGCASCRQGLYSCCENSNPNAGAAQKVFGHPLAGAFGYSHLTGGFAGGQAEYVRVPFADVGPLRVPEELTDDQALFLSDILPTAYMAAEMCEIQPGDVVAVWGAGPVGQLALDCARLLGARTVIAIDREPYRLKLAELAGHLVVNPDEEDLRERLQDLTAGRGPDRCIDAVGLEATSGNPVLHAYDRVKQAVRLESDRPHALREAILNCRSGGVVSVVGVYGGLVDKFPAGAWMNRGITLRAGQCHVQRYTQLLLDHVSRGDLDPTRVITHRLALAEGPYGYEIFKNKEEDCLKVVLTP